jgi:hypothetical protein
MPIYAMMADVLSLKRLVSQLDANNSSGRFRLNFTYGCKAVYELTKAFPDIEAYVMNNDRTLFSFLAHKYESAILHLLAQHEVAGIAPAILQAFQQSYASTAFRCRFPHCDRLSLGFATAELRLEHENVHIRRVYCQTVPCQYSRIGFATRNALNAHTRKHHSQSDVLLIPAKVRRTTDGLPSSPEAGRSPEPTRDTTANVAAAVPFPKLITDPSSMPPWFDAPSAPPTSAVQQPHDRQRPAGYFSPPLMPIYPFSDPANTYQTSQAVRESNSRPATELSQFLPSPPVNYGDRLPSIIDLTVSVALPLYL